MVGNTPMGGDALGGFGNALGGVAAGAGSIIGAGISASASVEAQKLANEHNWSAMLENFEFNKGMAREQRNWAKMMSDTAYRRQMDDMQKAGLNPIMAAMKGGGASTPNVGTGGSSAMSVAKPEPRGQHIKEMVKGGIMAATALEGLRVQKANRELLKQQKETSFRQQQQFESTVLKQQAEINNIDQDTLRKKYELLSAPEKAKYERDYMKLQRKLMIPDAVINRGGKIASSAAQLYGAGKLGKLVPGESRAYKALERKHNALLEHFRKQKK